MTWVPSNNQYDGINIAAINDIELNSPFYKWDFLYVVPLAPKAIAPLLTYEDEVTTGEDGVRSHFMRVMIVPPEKGRC